MDNPPGPDRHKIDEGRPSDDPENYIEWEVDDGDRKVTLGAGTASDEADVFKKVDQVLCTHRNEGHKVFWVIIRQSHKGSVKREAYAVDFETEVSRASFYKVRGMIDEKEDATSRRDGC